MFISLHQANENKCCNYLHSLIHFLPIDKRKVFLENIFENNTLNIIHKYDLTFLLQDNRELDLSVSEDVFNPSYNNTSTTAYPLGELSDFNLLYP